MTDNLKKQPSETRIFGMSFKNKLRSSTDVIQSITSVSIYPDDATLTAVDHSITTDTAYITVASGSDDRTYKLTVIVSTSEGQVLENEGYLKVLDS